MAISIPLKRVSPLVLMIVLVICCFATLLRRAENKPRTHLDRYGDALPPGAIARLGTIRLRSSHEVYFLAALPDGKRFLSIAKRFSEYDGRGLVSERKVVVCLWRTATGELLRRYQLPISDPVDAALSPNGKYLVTAGYSKSDGVSRILLWDVDTGTKCGEFPDVPQIGDQVFALSFTSDGKTLATTGGDATFRLWDMERRKEVRRFKGGKNLWGLFSIAGDGKVLALVRDQLELWDTASGKRLHSYPLGEAGWQARAFSPDGKLLATENRRNKLIQLWEVASGKEVWRLQSELEIITLAFSPDGKMLAGGSVRATGRIRSANPICVWDVKTGREVRRMPRHIAGSYCLTFSPDGTRMIAGGLYGILHVLDVASGKDVLTFPAHEDHVNSIAFSPDDRIVASAGQDGTIRLWERATSKLMRNIASAPGQGIERIVFADEGRSLISAGNDESLHFWDVATGDETRCVKVGDKGTQLFFACAPDGKTLAVCSENEPLRLLDAATGKERRRFADITSLRGFFCFSPDGTRLASVCWLRGERGSFVVLLDTVTGKRLRKWTFGKPYGPIAFSADGRTLFMAEGYNYPFFLGNKDFHAWNIFSGEDRPLKVDQLAWVCCLTRSPDGRMLAWGDIEGIITLWDIAARKIRRRLKGHEGFVLALAFSADGKTLASGSADTSVLLWDVLAAPE